MPRTLFSFRQPAGSDSRSVSAVREGSSLVIRVRPPADLVACSELETHLAEAELSDAKRILLDLNALESLDARMLHVILKASRRAARNGDRLRVTRGRGHVSGIFRLTALDQTIHFE